jgi:hypothetical protein
MPRPKSNIVSDDFRRLVHGHLRRASHTPNASVGTHLDEDALSVFVEGRLGEAEAAPIIKHLVGCGSCRRITAQLIRLDAALAEAAPEMPPTKDEPGRIRRLLGELASRVFPSAGDDAVFAYHAPADDFEKKDEMDGKEATDVSDSEEGSAVD